MATYSFLNGARYKRRDVLRAIGMDPPPTQGPYINGYFEHKGAHFIFCNVGVPGRTGHDYENRFEGDDLAWTGKNGSKADHPSIVRLTNQSAEVHIFFREDNREPFVYLGLGTALSVDANTPVGVRWGFEPYVGESELDPAAPSGGGDEHSIEGRKSVRNSVRYERSPTARARCIKHFGPTCQVCGMDFSKTYGAWGAGFIHVHHHVPVASIGEAYAVDPVRDLIPVCPNCHAMLHRKRDALSVGQLRTIMRTAE